jgi:hypothetical protein
MQPNATGERILELLHVLEERLKHEKADASTTE